MERRDDAGPEANGGASKDSDAARGERMRARLRELLASPYSFLPSYAARYETLLHYAQALIPQQAYAMCMLLGRDNASGYPDMPDTASLRFPAVHEVDLSTQVGWYYLNGLCTAEDGTEYGVLCMLFRYALLPPAAAAPFGLTPLENQVVQVQLALSVGDGPFYQADPSLTTGTSGRLAVSPGKLGLSADDGSFEAIPDGTFLPMRVAARGTDRSGERPVDLEVDLTLVFGRPFLPQGWDGAVPLVAGVGTRYYSVPGLMLYAQGSTLKVDGKAIPLKSGSFWFDHQWGVGLLPQAAPPVEALRAAANLNAGGPGGWDFFTANLDGPHSLTLNASHTSEMERFLNQSGATPPGPLTGARVAGKYMDPFGTVFNVSGTMDIDDWRKTQPAANPAKYPNTEIWVPHGWRFTLLEGVLPDNLRELRYRPICDSAQALTYANGARYVEAACRVFDAKGERIGIGYSEAVGYVDSLRTFLSLAGLPVTEEALALFRAPPVDPALWLESLLYMADPAHQAELKRITACGSFPPGPRAVDSGAEAAPAGGGAAPDPIEAVRRLWKQISEAAGR
jgi:predicted secreted hydrolase